MKKIVYRKIAKDCLNFFLVITFTISLIIWVLQAVNYLDFVIEDGHSFLVYFKYTLFSFPKIFSRIFPFSIFLAFSYIFLKYENKNELVIFWNFGVKKINFINFFIKFSLFFALLSLILNAIITPFTQDRARSFIRSSDLGFFESMLKPKKFIDAFGNLTIYFDEKNNNGELKNIFLNERTNFNNSQTTFAKTGLIKKNNNNDNDKILELYDGRTINNVNGKSSEFSFAKTDYNMSNFGTKTITQQKVQETSTMDLIECSFLLNSVKISSTKEINDIINCTFENLENIYEEIYSRLLKPMYTTFLITISLLIILKSRSDPSFNLNKLKIYLFGFIFVIFIESSSKFISLNLMQNLLFIILPFFLTLTIYLYFITTLRVARK
jgi:lipopolysaccharide export system permease protein